MFSSSISIKQCPLACALSLIMITTEYVVVFSSIRNPNIVVELDWMDLDADGTWVRNTLKCQHFSNYGWELRFNWMNQYQVQCTKAWTPTCTIYNWSDPLMRSTPGDLSLAIEQVQIFEINWSLSRYPTFSDQYLRLPPQMSRFGWHKAAHITYLML